MQRYNQNFIQKPPQIKGEFELLVTVGIMDTPLVSEGLEALNYYQRSNLAFNDKLGIMQVYVNAETEEGINRFLEDFPNANVQETDLVEGDWLLLAYPNEDMPEGSTPLDRFFQGRIRDRTESKV